MNKKILRYLRSTANIQLLWLKCNCTVKHHHHHHHVVPPARISLTISRHFSLSFIASGRSSMNDREKWREMVRDIRAGGTTWWWWWWCFTVQLHFNHNNCILAVDRKYRSIFLFISCLKTTLITSSGGEFKPEQNCLCSILLSYSSILRI